MKVSIYCSTHGPSTNYISECFKPILVGKKANHFDYGILLSDDQGENISEKNPYYCELTAQYWAWKNDHESTHFGFMHYRRHLNFTPTEFNKDVWGCVVREEMGKSYEDEFGFDQTNIEPLLEEYDIVLPEKWDVTSAGSKNNYEHYKNGEFLHIEDYNEAINIVTRKYPDYSPFIKEFNESNVGYYTNIFIMKRADFKDYSEWLFDILSELEDNISLRGYCAQERRVVGHVAERLFNIYIAKLIKEKELKVKELQRTFVKNVPQKAIINKKMDNALPYVICFDNNYAHSGGALIQSIIDNSSVKNNYEINIFCDAVSPENRNNLLSLIKNVPNFSMRLINTSALFNSEEMNVSEHFTAATYARLFIPQVFPEYKKIVFIDADMIVCDDIAKLYSIDLKGHKIGAVKDIVTEGFVKFDHLAPKEFPSHTSYTYLKNYLGMKDPDNYFQAGLLIMDLESIILEGNNKSLISRIYEKKYWYHDQDILNVEFEGDVEFIDMSWNVYHGNGSTDDFFPNLKLSTYLAFLKARENKKIVHFAGDQKPWVNPKVDYANLYYESVAKTPWALVYNSSFSKEIADIAKIYKDTISVNVNKSDLTEHITSKLQGSLALKNDEVQQLITAIFDYMDNQKQPHEQQRFLLRRLKLEIKLTIKRFVLYLNPVGTKRHAFISKLYRKLNG